MEQVMLDMIPTGAKAVCHVSQYDIGRTIRFNLISGGAAYTLAGTETVKVYIKKPDGTTAERNIANTSSTYVDWVTGEGDCDQAGKCECELIITAGTIVIGSKNFIMNVEEDPYNEQGVVMETAGPAVIATFTTNVVDLLQEVKCSINPIQSGSGTPYPAGGGKNKFDDTQATGTNFTDNNGTFTNTVTDTQTIFRFALQAYNNYTFVSNLGAAMITSIGRTSLTFTFPSGANVLRIKHNGSQQDIVMNYPWTTTGEFTLSLDILGYNPSVVGGLSFKNVQIEEGNTATDYEPYENICPISGFDELNVMRNGLNFANIKPYSQWNVLSSDYALSGSIFPANQRLKMVLFDKDTSVDVSGCYFGFCSSDYSSGTITNKQYRWILLNGEIMPNKENYPTSGDQTIFLDALFIYPKNEATYNKVFSRFNVMVVFDSETPTEYKPYTGKLIKLEFDDTVYLAEVSYLNGVWKALIKGRFVEYDGSSDENWSLLGSGSASAFAMRSAIAINNINIDVVPMANYLQGIPRIVTWSNYDNWVSVTADKQIVTGVQSITDVDVWKTYLSNNPLQVVYELATPIEITLDETEQFEALLGVNNVWHDGNGNTEVKYLYNA